MQSPVGWLPSSWSAATSQPETSHRAPSSVPACSPRSSLPSAAPLRPGTPGLSPSNGLVPCGSSVPHPAYLQGSPLVSSSTPEAVDTTDRMTIPLPQDAWPQSCSVHASPRPGWPRCWAPLLGHPLLSPAACTLSSQELHAGGQLLENLDLKARTSHHDASSGSGPTSILLPQHPSHPPASAPQKLRLKTHSTALGLKALIFFLKVQNSRSEITFLYDFKTMVLIHV